VKPGPLSSGVEILEHAARRLRQEGGEKKEPAPAGHRR
jgi:hypothetical protein